MGIIRNCSLLNRTLVTFILYTIVILALATPLFYILTKNFYAEDMLDIIESVRRGSPVPKIDLEEDIMKGVMLQFLLISTVLGVAFVVMMRAISGRLWKPFDDTLFKIENFKLEKETVPEFQKSSIREFERLNAALRILVVNNLASYKSQKEFTENASHELQTPLAVLQSKLEILMQLPDLTHRQADVIQEMMTTLKRMSKLNRSLLMLARIDNHQYGTDNVVDVGSEIKSLLPSLELLTGDIRMEWDIAPGSLTIKCNSVLLESLITNLIVNAVRHNCLHGTVLVKLIANELSVENTSDEPALNPDLVFNRFYKPSGGTKGNGLGLAIVKAICTYYGWQITYTYKNNGCHLFKVKFLS